MEPIIVSTLTPVVQMEYKYVLISNASGSIMAKLCDLSAPQRQLTSFKSLFKAGWAPVHEIPTGTSILILLQRETRKP